MVQKIYFLTGNRSKVLEARHIVSLERGFDVIGFTLQNLPEIQSTKPEDIIEAKLDAARAIIRDEYIQMSDYPIMVEDSSLFIEGLGCLSGPNIRFAYEQTEELPMLGSEGLAQLALASGKTRAWARCDIGYMRQDGTTLYVHGRIDGRIVEPRGSYGFDWDTIFEPDEQPPSHPESYSKDSQLQLINIPIRLTFAEMSPAQKDTISMRKKALEALVRKLEAHEQSRA